MFGQIVMHVMSVGDALEYYKTKHAIKHIYQNVWPDS